jgi:hypothetical protein
MMLSSRGAQCVPYFVVDWRVRDEIAEGLADIDVIPASRVPWGLGVLWAPGRSVPDPIEFVLDENRGTEVPDAFWVGIPLFSWRMLEVLRQAGVDNINTYNAVIIDPRTNTRYETHKAVNIIGVVACAHLRRSEYDPEFEAPRMSFRRLVVDEVRAHGLLFFRLAEDPGIIVAHETVANALTEAKLTGIRVFPAN